jgi:phage FluMu gp28-like protein
MTREFIDACAMWARAYSIGTAETEEFLFEDKTPEGDKSIQAFRIRFASGFEIMALSSAPRSLRGKDGVVMIDEAAFVDNLAELLKAALAFLVWGGQVVVCSTHDGWENEFNNQIQEILAGKLPYEHVKITLDDALQDGLYERICFVNRKEWTPEGEADWRDKLIKRYAAGAPEELFCIPSKSAGADLSRALSQSRMSDEIPVIRWTPPDVAERPFVDWPEPARRIEVFGFCREKLRPLLLACDPTRRSVLGQDFARSGDGSVILPAQVTATMLRRAVFQLELRDVPFDAQQWILFYIINHLPRFSHGAFDATGNGAAHAEAARQKYGVARISEIKMTGANDWYMLNMPKMKSAFEDGSILLPLDDDTITDYRLIAMESGVAKVPAGVHSIGSDGRKRHGDAGIAGALMIYASNQDGGEVGAGLPLDNSGPDVPGDFLSGFGGGVTAHDLDDFLRM